MLGRKLWTKGKNGKRNKKMEKKYIRKKIIRERIIGFIEASRKITKIKQIRMNGKIVE